ncbi:hypothetical protein PS2_044092 [Malus domestica]
MAGAAGEGSGFEIAQDEAVAIKDKYANKQKALNFEIHAGKERNCLCWISTTLCLITGTCFNLCGLFFTIFLQLLTRNMISVCNQVGASNYQCNYCGKATAGTGTNMNETDYRNPNYKITALLDYLAMITVQFDSRGIFDCKPLCLIWTQFPEVCITIM